MSLPSAKSGNSHNSPRRCRCRWRRRGCSAELLCHLGKQTNPHPDTSLNIDGVLLRQRRKEIINFAIVMTLMNTKTRHSVGERNVVMQIWRRPQQCSVSGAQERFPRAARSTPAGAGGHGGKALRHCHSGPPSRVPTRSVAAATDVGRNKKCQQANTIYYEYMKLHQKVYTGTSVLLPLEPLQLWNGSVFCLVVHHNLYAVAGRWQFSFIKETAVFLPNSTQTVFISLSL